VKIHDASFCTVHFSCRGVKSAWFCESSQDEICEVGQASGKLASRFGQAPEAHGRCFSYGVKCLSLSHGRVFILSEKVAVAARSLKEQVPVINTID
jgi:hypothetical protein